MAHNKAKQRRKGSAAKNWRREEERNRFSRAKAVAGVLLLAALAVAIGSLTSESEISRFLSCADFPRSKIVAGRGRGVFAKCPIKKGVYEIRANDMRLLEVMGKTKSAALPDFPTMLRTDDDSPRPPMEARLAKLRKQFLEYKETEKSAANIGGRNVYLEGYRHLGPTNLYIYRDITRGEALRREYGDEWILIMYAKYRYSWLTRQAQANEMPDTKTLISFVDSIGLMDDHWAMLDGDSISDYTARHSRDRGRPMVAVSMEELEEWILLLYDMGAELSREGDDTTFGLVWLDFVEQYGAPAIRS